MGISLSSRWVPALCAFTLSIAPVWAQSSRVVSPEVGTNGEVTFRLRAPKAQSVRFESADIWNLGQRAHLTKNSNDVWEVTLPVQPGAWRYHFNVDGVAVNDPANPATSESNEYVRSLLYVPGADFMDTKDVPHGAVAQVTYYSSALKRFRRLHVYTPPDYESGKGRFPVFYLLHGAMDCDNAWVTVGRAGFILDNLIAAGKARPMVVVMPAGHTGPYRMGASFGDDFEKDFINDIMPLVEKRYRIKTSRNSRAIAGLSMGGAQALNISMAQFDKFAYIGVFSSGVFGIAGGRGGRGTPDFEQRNVAALDNSALKKGLKLCWFATGKQDSLIATSRATVDMMKKHNFNVVFKETEGAHSWIVWREYLNEFAPQLFQ
jgi:enterochelin esterase-like enzyme